MRLFSTPQFIEHISLPYYNPGFLECLILENCRVCRVNSTFSIKHGRRMVFIQNGDSEIGPHAGSNISYFICVRHLIRLRSVTIRNIFLQKEPIFLPPCATCFDLPSKISTAEIRGKNTFVFRLLEQCNDVEKNPGPFSKKSKSKLSLDCLTSGSKY